MLSLILVSFVVLQLAQDRVIGLLPLPEVFGETTCAPFTPKTLDLFARPAAGSQRVGTIEVVTPVQQESNGGCTGPVVRVNYGNATGDLPTEEIAYEIPAGVVYERSGSWFRLRLDRGSGWIQISGPERFVSYPALVSSDERLPYLERTWDGTLRSAPGQSAARIPLPPSWRALVGKEIPYVTIVESRTQDGELWFRIRLTPENACVDPPANLPLLDGWIPAYAGANRLVWFYSRGC
jgi:hypothetical protein